MKTDKNSRTHSTTSGTSSHPELTVPDKFKRYQAVIVFEQKILLKTGIVTTSQAKAEAMARTLDPNDFSSASILFKHHTVEFVHVAKEKTNK